MQGANDESYQELGRQQITFDQILIADATEVARRTRRNKFGRLSNNRIISLLRHAAKGERVLQDAPDAELLDRWFGAYGRALEELRDEH